MKFRFPAQNTLYIRTSISFFIPLVIFFLFFPFRASWTSAPSPHVVARLPMSGLNQFIDGLHFDGNSLTPSENPPSVFSRRKARHDWHIIAPDASTAHVRVPNEYLASSPLAGYTALYSGYADVGLHLLVSHFL